MSESLKVQSQHLDRSAYLYVRQSSMRQVIENVESTKLSTHCAAARSRSAGVRRRSWSSIVIRANRARRRLGAKVFSIWSLRSAWGVSASSWA